MGFMTLARAAASLGQVGAVILGGWLAVDERRAALPHAI